MELQLTQYVKLRMAATLWGGASSFDKYVIRLNETGDTLWSQLYAGPSSGSVRQIVPVNDGYLLRGRIFNSSNHIAKINNTGIMTWFNDTLWVNDMEVTSDGNAILLRGEGPQFDVDPRLIKIIVDSGSIAWDKTYDFVIDFSTPRRIIALNDGSYLGMGGYNGTILLNVSANGDSLWSNVVYDSGSPIPLDIIQTSDGGFMVAGVVSGGLFDSDIYLLKLDQNGFKEWSASLFRMGYDEWPRNIAQHSDGGYIIFGWGENGSIGGDDWLFVKTDSMGVIPGLWEEELNRDAQFIIYPNPATDKVQFVSKHIFSGTLTLYDIKGRMLWQTELDKSTGWVIPVVNLEIGMYLIKILDVESGEIETFKLLKN